VSRWIPGSGRRTGVGLRIPGPRLLPGGSARTGDAAGIGLLVSQVLIEFAEPVSKRRLALEVLLV
jgi:hypothetical protein